MITDVWKALLEYLKRTKLWPWLEPILLVGFLYTGLVVAAFQFVQWRYGITLPPSSFRGSYIFSQVSVAFLALLLSYLILIVSPGRADELLAPLASRRWLSGKNASVIVRTSAIALVLTVATFIATWLSPHSQVSSIRVMIAPAAEFVHRDRDDEPFPTPAFDIAQHSGLLIYLLFELNRLQGSWQFEMDLEPFMKQTAQQASDRCDGDPESPITCYAEAFQRAPRARGMGEGHRPLMVVTSGRLGPLENETLYWLHNGGVSVITTNDWHPDDRLSVLEYLAYALTLQAIVTHFDIHCKRYAFTYSATDNNARKSIAQQEQDRRLYTARRGADRVVDGNVFQPPKQRDSLRAAILAGHLGHDDEERLLNCFGPEYMRTAEGLLRLEWLHSERVRDNLRKVFGVKDDLLPGASSSQ